MREIFVELNLGESLFPFTKACFDAEDSTLLCMLAEMYFCNTVEGMGIHSRTGSLLRVEPSDHGNQLLHVRLCTVCQRCKL